MKITTVEKELRTAVSWLTGMLLSTLALSCGPVEQQTAFPSTPGRAVRGLDEDNGLAFNGLAFNGLAFNGLAFNGLAFNGLAFNGLAFNGLAFNGLSSSSFSSWFQENPPLSHLFMKYLVRCAVPAGQTRSYSDGSYTYTWYGSLGLAPDWASGVPATLEEQQVVTACLGALVNKFGRSITLSVLGANARGQPIPYTSSELTDFPQREACFFGNIFNGEGLYVGNDQDMLPSSKSSLRACALASNSACPPLIHIGGCEESCEPDSTGPYYTRCTRGGITYRPLTTRLRSQEIFTCGDGLCQPTESCGSGTRYDDCALDCGSCD